MEGGGVVFGRSSIKLNIAEGSFAQNREMTHHYTIMGRRVTHSRFNPQVAAVHV